MKKLIRRVLFPSQQKTVSGAIYLLVYCVVCFVRWEIYNPVNLFVDIPFMSYSERAIWLCMYCISIGAIQGAAWLYVKLKEEGEI